MEPLISIIIPTYNSEKYFTECLDSVIKQSYKNIEVIIVDGGSVDSTKLIANRYCNKYNNWHFITTKKGVAHQRNIGLNTFKGDYVFFLDSDDYIGPDLILKLYKTITEKKLDVVTPSIFSVLYDGYTLLKSEKITIKLIPEVTPDNFFEEGYDSFLAGPTKLYKRELLSNIKHNENLSYGEDLLFNYEVVKKQKIKFGIEEDAIYCYRHYVNIKNIAKKRMEKSGYLFCNLMVDILNGFQLKNKNYYGCLKILKINIDLYIEAYTTELKLIPLRLLKSRLFMYKNTQRKYRYYYLFLRTFKIINHFIVKKLNSKK